MPPEEPPSTPETTARFILNKYMVSRAIFEEVERGPREANEQKPAQLVTAIEISVGVQDVQLTSAPTLPAAFVTMTARLRPDLKWQPYRIEVEVRGLFSAENTDKVVFDQFCRQAVPPILLPYVRQIVHQLTVDAAFGPVRIDPLNVAQILDQTKWVQAPGRTGFYEL